MLRISGAVGGAAGSCLKSAVTWTKWAGEYALGKQVYFGFAFCFHPWCTVNAVFLFHEFLQHFPLHHYCMLGLWAVCVCGEATPWCSKFRIQKRRLESSCFKLAACLHFWLYVFLVSYNLLSRLWCICMWTLFSTNLCWCSLHLLIWSISSPLWQQLLEVFCSLCKGALSFT